MSVQITELREPNFGVDLPGEWEQIPPAEDVAMAFAEVDGDRTLTVMLLAPKAVFSLADPVRMLQDYLSHRARFEAGQLPNLKATEPAVLDGSEVLAGGWSAVDPESGRRLRHYVVRDRELLADFCYAASGLAEDEFAAEADAVFATAYATAGAE